MDGVLSEQAAGPDLALGDLIPRAVQLALLLLHEVEDHLLLAGVGVQQQSLEKRLHHGVRVARHGHRDAQRVLDGLVLPEQHLQHDAVHGIVLPVEGDDAHLLAWLAVAVYAALPLLVAGGVPTEVVVDDRVEVALQVDALGEAVRADQHPLRRLGQVQDPLFALGRGEGAGHGCHFHALQAGAQRLGHVLGGGDEAAEEDGVEASLHQFRHQRQGPLELGVGLPAQLVGLARELQQPPAMAVPLLARISARADVHALGGLVVQQVQDAPAAHLVGSLGRLGVGRRSAVAQGGHRRRRAGGQRAQQRQGRPPAHTLPVLPEALVHHGLAGVVAHPLQQAAPGRADRVGHLDGLALRERRIRLHVVADVAPAPLHEVARQLAPVRLILPAGQVSGQRGELCAQESQ